MGDSFGFSFGVSVRVRVRVTIVRVLGAFPLAAWVDLRSSGVVVPTTYCKLVYGVVSISISISAGGSRVCSGLAEAEVHVRGCRGGGGVPARAHMRVQSVADLRRRERRQGF